MEKFLRQTNVTRAPNDSVHFEYDVGFPDGAVLHRFYKPHEEYSTIVKDGKELLSCPSGQEDGMIDYYKENYLEVKE